MSDDTYTKILKVREPEIEAIAQIAREHAEPAVVDRTVDESHVFVVPAGAELKLIAPDETLLDRPRRLTGRVMVDDVASLEAYVAEFYDEDFTTVWVDPQERTIVAVLNDARNGESAWRDHRATLRLERTPEWKRWLDHDSGGSRNPQLLDQEEFARHIERSELDIVDPEAAELLEIAQTFYATTAAEFRSGTRLQSGEVQFTWVEDTSATAGRNGQLPIPAKFRLLIAPFTGEEKCAVEALLRYRIRDGKLRIGYELVRPEDVERDAMDLVAERLRGNVRRVYLGSPA